MQTDASKFPVQAAAEFDAGLSQDRDSKVVELKAVEAWELDPDQIWVKIKQHGVALSGNTWQLSAVFGSCICGVMISESGAPRPWRERWVYASAESEFPSTFSRNGNCYSSNVMLSEAMASAVEIIKKIESK